MGIGKDFLNRTLITQDTKVRTDKLDCAELKGLCTARDNYQNKDHLQNWRKYLPSIHQAGF
jgi:hypothetical protein